MARKDRPHTSDGRYLVAKGILKRCTNPTLDDSTRRRSVKQLMQARILVKPVKFGGTMTHPTTVESTHQRLPMLIGGNR